MPLDGSHFSFKENQRIINTPKKNDGIEEKSMAITVDAVSAREYFFTADTIPTGIPITDAAIIDRNARFKVTGNFGSKT